MEINLDKVIENEYEREYYLNLRREINEFLNHNGGSDFQQIVKTIGGSDRRVLRLLNEMRKCNEIIINGKKISSRNQSTKNKYLEDVSCNSCNSKLIPLRGIFAEMKQKMDEIYSKKPVPTFLYDQRPVNSETTIRRAAYLLWRNDLIGKEIVILGDDDLTSLAIGLSGLAKRITVLDIDERVIKFINKTSKEKGLKIEARVCDFTKDIPEDLKNKFDVFFTDPTPISECFSTFISIGIKLLKEEEGKVGYASFFPSHQEISIDFQEILSDNGLIITDMIPKFTEYDFLEQTYSKEDKEILKELDSGENKISFFENQTRFVTSKKTLRRLEENSISKIPLSKAIKRIIKDPSKDPAFMAGEKEFVINKLKKLKDEI